MKNVSINNKKNGVPVTYTLVSAKEAAIKAEKICVRLLIYKDLLGYKVGDKTKIQVPAGKIEFEIQDISIS